jgi:hypothetical protein
LSYDRELDFPATHATSTVKTILFIGVAPYTSWHPTVAARDLG